MSKERKIKFDYNWFNLFLACVWRILGSFANLFRLIFQNITLVFHFQFVVLIFVGVSLVIWDTFRERKISFASVAVPPELASIGYTPRVVSQRLIDTSHCYYRDDERFGMNDNSNIHESNLLHSGTEQDLILPTMGISLNSITSYFREVLGVVDRTISGEMVYHGSNKKVYLRLRFDREEIFHDSQDYDNAGITKLINDGAYAVTKVVAPHVLASYHRERNEIERTEDILRYIFSNHGGTESYIYGITLKGVLHADKKEYDAAIDEYERATTINPTFANAYNNWGVALVRTEKYTEAIEKYKMAIEHRPEFAAALSNLGAVYTRLERFDEAIEQYEQSIEINPSDARTYNNWGFALVSRANPDDFDEAIKHYRRATEIDPNYSGAYSGWAETLARQGNAEEAKIIQDLGNQKRAPNAHPEETRYRVCQGV